MFSSTVVPILLLLGSAQAHLYITYPLPYRAKENKAASNPNYDISFPIKQGQWPCSGESGPSVTTLKAGEATKLQFSGGAPHNGGSCQVALSFDGQKTFQVVHSFIGGCPIAEGSLPYTLPSDTPIGDATLAWVWHNKVGNREVYSNCAGVTIEASSGGSTPAIPFKDRPDLFVGNLDNGCIVPEGSLLVYPEPGPDVTGDASGTPLTGCQPINGIGNTARGSGGSSPQPPVSQPSSAPAPVPSEVITQPPTTTTGPVTGEPLKSPSESGTPPPSAPTGSAPTSPGGQTLSPDGTCGAKYRCAPGFCCSTSGFCGNSELHCKGTQPAVRRALRAGHGRFHFKHH